MNRLFGFVQMGLSGFRVLIFVVSTQLFLQGCAATPLPARFEKAQAAELKGDHVKALNLYRGISKNGKRAQDRLMARFRAAGVLYAMGLFEKAMEEYLETTRYAAGEARKYAQARMVAARALYRAGCIAYDKLGGSNPERKEEGLRLWWRALNHYPGEVAADEALVRVVRHNREQGRLKEIVKDLWALFRRFRRADIADNLLWNLGEIYEKDFNAPDHAVEIFAKLAKIKPHGPLTYDASMRTARLYRRLGKPLKALLFYAKILETKKDTWIVGTFTSEFADDAQLEIGILRLDDMKDPVKAIEEFRRLVDDFQTSILRDDALWWIAIAELRRDNMKGAKRAHKELVRRFPKSRFVDRAAQLMNWTLVAQAIKRGDNEKLCDELAVHAEKYPFGWFRQRRKTLSKRFDCGRFAEDD